MKRLLTVFIAAAVLLSFISCGKSDSGKQTIGFCGITMEIPASWKPDDRTISDDYAIYQKLNYTGHDYKLQFMKTFSLLGTFNGDLERTGAFFKETAEDDASYLNPSDPVAGKFAGVYDMHTIECLYHVINLTTGKEIEYPCKLIRVYMDDYDVVIQFSAKKGDFEAFDAAVSAAVCE